MREKPSNARHFCHAGQRGPVRNVQSSPHRAREQLPQALRVCRAGIPASLTAGARSSKQRSDGARMERNEGFMTQPPTPDPEPVFIEVGSGDSARRIAVRASAGNNPGLFWLGGFNSNMTGSKAVALDAWAVENYRACVRFDYSGHGESGGAFVDGTIGRWLEESLAVFDRFCSGPQVVIGSSMGGWMALLLARAIATRKENPATLAGLVLIAPAPDFTEALMWKGFSSEIRQQIETQGVWMRPSPYDDGAPYPIT